MNFAVFDKDGNAVRAGVCPDGKAEMQAKSGETAIEWDKANGFPLDWKLADGKLERK